MPLKKFIRIILIRLSEFGSFWIVFRVKLVLVIVDRVSDQYLNVTFVFLGQIQIG